VLPLADLLPDWIHPVLGLSAEELKEALLPTVEPGSIRPL